MLPEMQDYNNQRHTPREILPSDIKCVHSVCVREGGGVNSKTRMNAKMDLHLLSFEKILNSLEGFLQDL